MKYTAGTYDFRYFLVDNNQNVFEFPDREKLKEFLKANNVSIFKVNFDNEYIKSVLEKKENNQK